MKGKVVLTKGNAVVVSYRDHTGTVRTRLFSGTITDVRVGQVIELSEETISTGTEYGLDWDVLMPGGFGVSSQELQNVLADRGVYTDKDVRENPKLVNAAINVLMKRLLVEIYDHVKSIGG